MEKIISEFIIESIGDESVGIRSSQYILKGDFYFDGDTDIADFKEDIKNLFDKYGFSETKLNIMTDKEYTAMCDYENEISC